MELCPRCHGGEIHAPNCPICGGSGFVSGQAVPQAAPSVAGSCVSPEARRRQVQSYRRAREEEKRRAVRVSTKYHAPTPGTDASLTPEERRDREKWRGKYQRRQERRMAEEKRRRKLTAEQLEEERRKRREKAYMRRLNRMKLAEKGSDRPRRAKPKQGDKRTRATAQRISREEQSAQQARNNQMEEKLRSLLGASSRGSDDAPHPGKGRAPSAGKESDGGRSKRSRQVAARPRGGSNRDFPGECPPPIPLDEVRKEFSTALPGFEREEDASRYIGHSFRDHGEYGSYPMHDDYDES